jgi:hypothetical protein
MLRKTFVTAMLLGGMATGASAQTPLAFWDGTIVIDSVSAVCKNAGTPPGSQSGFVQVNNRFNASFRAKLSPSDPNSGLTFVSDRSMQAYFQAPNQAGDTASDQMNGKGTYALRVLRGNVTSTPSPDQPSPCSGKFTFKLKPTQIAADTDSITIDGTINDYRCTPGCTVKFRGAFRSNPLNP